VAAVSSWLGWDNFIFASHRIFLRIYKFFSPNCVACIERDLATILLFVSLALAGARRKIRFSQEEAAWTSPKTSALEDLRHNHVVRRRIRWNQRSVGWGQYKAGYYTTYEDIRDNSEYFVAVSVPVPDAMVNTVSKSHYPIPFVRTTSDWCEATRSVVSHDSAARNAESGDNSYHKCVLSSHLLPIPSGSAALGRLPGDNLSQYFDAEFLNKYCRELQTYRAPELRTEDTIPPPISFMLYTKDALVLDTGSVHSISSKFTEHFQAPRGCFHWSELGAGGRQCKKGEEGKFDLKQRKWPKVSKVFVITQVYGDRVFHFLTESLPRLAMVYQVALRTAAARIPSSAPDQHHRTLLLSRPALTQCYLLPPRPALNAIYLSHAGAAGR
jgi:hypothetical protein